MSDPRLIFGDVDLLGVGKGFELEAAGSEAGTGFGNPVPITKAIASFLQDGALVATTRHDNREMPLFLTVRAETPSGLAAGEAAIVAECNQLAAGKRRALQWTPPNGAPTCVFDVVAAQLELDFDDFVEVSDLERRYKLTLTTLPFARSKKAISYVVPSPATSVVEEVISDGTSLTGWNYGGASGVDPDSQWELQTNGGNLHLFRESWNNIPGGTSQASFLEHDGLAVDMTNKPYLRINMWGGAAVSNGSYSPLTISVYLNGSSTPASVVAVNGNEYVYDASHISTLNKVRIVFNRSLTTTGMFTIDNYVDYVLASNSTVHAPTGRQNARQIPVVGSARSEASLIVADAAAALGSVLVYTTSEPNAVQPQLRPWKVSGPTATNDSTLVSGERSNLSTAHDFDLPAAGVPAAGYLLVVRIRNNNGAVGDALNWSASSRMGTTTIDTVTGPGLLLDPDISGVWQLLALDVLTLPPAQLGADGFVRIRLSATVSVDLDEAWLFNLENGQLTWVDCGSGTPAVGGPSSRLWVDSASVDDPKPSIWRGTKDTRSDAIHAGIATHAWGAHEFVPPLVNVFTVTTDSTAADVTLNYYPRWHTHAGV